MIKLLFQEGKLLGGGVLGGVVPEHRMTLNLKNSDFATAPEFSQRRILEIKMSFHYICRKLVRVKGPFDS